jgi:hypothetical protein
MGSGPAAERVGGGGHGCGAAFGGVAAGVAVAGAEAKEFQIILGVIVSKPQIWGICYKNYQTKFFK